MDLLNMEKLLLEMQVIMGKWEFCLELLLC